MKYITYNNIKDIDLISQFSTRLGVSRKSVASLIEMCEMFGATRVLDVVGTFGSSTVLSHRQVRYMQRSVQLHNELLGILKPGAKISEEGIVSRLRKDDEMLEVVNGEARIHGTYRDILLRCASW